MERRVPAAPAASPPPTGIEPLCYRAEIRRRTADGTSGYYEAGEFDPYAFDSLLETVHAESQTPHEELVVTVALEGACTRELLDESADRLAVTAGRRALVTVRAPGHRPVVRQTGVRRPPLTAFRSLP